MIASQPGFASRRRAGMLAFLFSCLCSCLLSLPASSEEATDPSIDRERLASLVPLVVQVVNLSVLDPILAASLVPDPWIQSIVEGAFDIAGETALPPGKSDPPLAWPVGPWATPSALVSTIRTAQPAAVASLYRALRPRFEGHCRLRKASFKACDEAIRIAAARLSAPGVRARAAGTSSAPITATQREVARLGVTPTAALQDQILLLAKKVWGEDWKSKAPRRRAGAPARQGFGG